MDGALRPLDYGSGDEVGMEARPRAMHVGRIFIPDRQRNFTLGMLPCRRWPAYRRVDETGQTAGVLVHFDYSGGPRRTVQFRHGEFCGRFRRGVA